MNTSELGDHSQDLLFGQNCAQAPGPFGPDQFDGQIQMFAQ